MQIRIAVDGGDCLGTIYHNGKAMVMMIDSVEVDEARRHTSIGTALMAEVVSVAFDHDVDSVELLVNADNVAAKSLYRKAGFTPTGKEHMRLILRHFA